MFFGIALFRDKFISWFIYFCIFFPFFSIFCNDRVHACKTSKTDWYKEFKLKTITFYQRKKIPAIDWCRSKQVRAGPVPVCVGWGRCGPLGVGAGWPPCRPVPRRDCKKRCSLIFSDKRKKAIKLIFQNFSWNIQNHRWYSPEKIEKFNLFFKFQRESI